MKEEKTSGWMVTQIDKAQQDDIAKSVKTFLERETKLDPNAIEATIRAVQSILLQQVGSLVGEILDHAEGVGVAASWCTSFVCSGNGVRDCPIQSCETLVCEGNKCSINSCGTKTCKDFTCGINKGITHTIFETPAWSAVLKDLELMSKHPELRQTFNLSTHTIKSKND